MSKRNNRQTSAHSTGQEALPAGEFSPWLRLVRRSQKLRVMGSEVPCGECTGCCRSFYFIHVQPDETDTLAHIPPELLFPAPGLPSGHVLMGYNERGECPLLNDNRCSIYEHRPQTCRDFDCRVFSATGISIENDVAQAVIAERVRRWKFEHPGEQDRKEHAAVQAAAAFLQERADGFPPGSLPLNPVQLAVLAIKVYEVFLELGEASGGRPRPSDAEIVKAVMDAASQGSGASCTWPSPPIEPP
jgi:uncharacterized protein